MTRRSEEIAAFIESSFGSIWTLEIFLHLKCKPWASLTPDELVKDMRASHTVVAKSIRSLIAAGMIIEDENGAFRYGPVSTEMADLAGETETLYRRQPDAVRRLIVLGGGNLKAFSDAFKLRKD